MASLPPARPLQPLNERQSRFVEEFCKDLSDAAAAAVRAGYAVKGAKEAAYRLRALPNVAAAIEQRLGIITARNDLDVDSVVDELKRVAFSDIGDILDMTGEVPKLKAAKDIPLAARRAISSVKVRRVLDGKGKQAREVEIIEFRLWDKNPALEKAMKYLGMLKDASPIVNTVNVVRVEIVDESKRRGVA
jgi:phage terminase small subunit